MIRLGKQVTKAGDQLYDVTVEKIHQALKNPTGEVASLQRRLQAIRAMDPGQYRKLKVNLPYLVCAQFHPKVRKKENFVFTDRFLVDIDHLSEHGLDMGQTRKIFEGDPRVELLFSSPSGDGLKVLFRLNNKIQDSQFYTAFYQAFCLQLEKDFKLGPALDHKTHDVSRCCFVSFDPDAYFNAQAEEIDPGSFVNEESLFEWDQIKSAISQIEKTHQDHKKNEQREGDSRVGQELSPTVLATIKEKIGQKNVQRKTKEYIQPEELEVVMEKLQGYLEEINAHLENVRPISYGRQVKVSTGDIWAEVNVFYGRKGVNIVRTTKTGSHKEFGEKLTEFLKVCFEIPQGYD